jgi:rubredoxin
MKAIFEVQTVDRQTGKEHWVRVEAESKDAAIAKIAGLGEVVGAARLVEVVDAPARRAVDSPAYRFAPGRVICPSCQSAKWTGGHGCALLLGVVLLFPLGLLLLLIRPEWRCERCGYAYRSHDSPMGSNRTPAVRDATILVAIVVFAVLIVVLVQLIRMM